MKKWFTPFLVLSALFFAAGCGTGSSELISRGLHITLNKVERAADGSFEVHWQLENPNVVAYVVDHSEHKIYLDGELVGTVFKKSRQGVPLQNKAEGTDPLTLAGPAAGAKLAQAIGQGPLAYRVDSTIWVLLADDELSKSTLVSSGSVPVTAK
jgi:hypothetical protein